MKKIPLIFLTALLLLGCGGGNVVLDNARTEAVTFSFKGGETVEVEAEGRSSIDLEPGTHEVEIKLGDSVVADTSFKLKTGGIVHSGGSRYVIWKQLYGLQNDRATLLNEKWVEVDSIRVYGDFTVYEPEWIFLEENWEYGLDDDFPESKTMYVTEDFQIESKVFRSQDMITYYKTLVAKPEEK